MPDIAHSAQDMIAGMTPRRTAGEYVFATTDDPALVRDLAPQAQGVFAEAEGTSMILPVDLAAKAGFDVTAPMHCITLAVYSALDGVGLTAAVAGALAQHGIPCNMVAAFHHDHVFVPVASSAYAIEILQALQKRYITKR